MQDELATPWFDSALARLALRRGERVLSIEPRLADLVALRAAIGGGGELTAVLADRALAESVAARQLPGLRVVAHAATGGERFGTFDAALCALHTGPVPSPAACAEMLRVNLRLGGRFVVDVPAEDMIPDLSEAWRQAARDEEPLAALQGPSDQQLVDALQRAGLRSVERELAAHMLHATSAADLVAGFAGDLGLDDAEVVELAHGLVRLRRADGPLEVLVRRACASGRR